MLSNVFLLIDDFHLNTLRKIIFCKNEGEMATQYQIQHLYTWEHLGNRIKVNGRVSLELTLDQEFTSEFVVFERAEDGEIYWANLEFSFQLRLRAVTVV